MIRRPPRSTLFPTRRSSDLLVDGQQGLVQQPSARDLAGPQGGRRQRHRPERHPRSEEHTSELQSRRDLVCRLLLEKKKKKNTTTKPKSKRNTTLPAN